MTITPAFLTRSSAAAAVAAGVVFIGVQIGHPPLDATTVTTTEVMVRSSLKVLMAVLALVGITGMYLHQVRRAGVLGLVGYLLFGANYLVIMSTSFVAACILPSIADTDPAYVDDVLTVATGGKAVGDIGLLHAVLLVESGLFLAAGLVFGIALYRARVLARWASVLLAVGGVATAALTLLPDPLYRLLALPNSIALIGLGCSLWMAVRADTRVQATTTRAPAVTAGVR
jgi:hypothetical protein